MEQVILIVEDDDPSYFYLEAILRQAPLTVLRAENGWEAIILFRQRPEISLVLMDLRMPVMDGLDATLRLKSMRKDLPIIAITAYAFTGDEKVAIAAGCDDYLTKPVNRDLLFLKLENFGLRLV